MQVVRVPSPNDGARGWAARRPLDARRRSQPSSIYLAASFQRGKATIRWAALGVYTRRSHSGISTALRLACSPTMQTTTSTRLERRRLDAEAARDSSEEERGGPYSMKGGREGKKWNRSQQLKVVERRERHLQKGSGSIQRLLSVCGSPKHD